MHCFLKEEQRFVWNMEEIHKNLLHFPLTRAKMTGNRKGRTA